MKQIKLVIIFFLISFITKGQSLKSDCDTITLKDGVIYHGRVIGMSKKVIKFINCDNFGLPLITISLDDVKKINYNRIQNNLYDLQRNKRIIKEQIKERDRNEKINIARDTNKYIHFGIIPYQFLTRSSALYFRYDLKNNSALEYRPSYTYATNLDPNYLISCWYYDNFYFQGINNSFLYYLPQYRRIQVALILSYKYWWHGKESVENDNSNPSFLDHDFHLFEYRSSVMNGVGLGIELNYYKKAYKNCDFNFFCSANFTYFNSYSHVYSVSFLNSPVPLTTTYPYTETKNRYYFNLTCGFKFGYKKKIK